MTKRDWLVVSARAFLHDFGKHVRGFRDPWFRYGILPCLALALVMVLVSAARLAV